MAKKRQCEKTERESLNAARGKPAGLAGESLPKDSAHSKSFFLLAREGKDVASKRELRAFVGRLA